MIGDWSSVHLHPVTAQRLVLAGSEPQSRPRHTSRRKSAKIRGFRSALCADHADEAARFLDFPPRGFSLSGVPRTTRSVLHTTTIDDAVVAPVHPPLILESV